MKEKRKIYVISPAILAFSLLLIGIGYAVSLTMFWDKTELLEKLVLIGIGVLFVLVMWSSQIIIIKGNVLTRIYFLLYVKRFQLLDITAVTVERDSSMYGTINYMKVAFKDGDYLNYYLGTVASTKDFVNRIYAVAPDKIDPAVFEFTKKPY